MIGFIKTHKMCVLSALLMVIAAALGADGGFAMAVVDPAELANTGAGVGSGEPAANMDAYDATTNPNGRPADEALQADEQGGNTQLQGKSATATDVRDAGLEAEDYDPDVDNFRKFRFPIETYVARQCRPVKAKSYVHGHFRAGSTDIEAVYTGSAITITAGSTSGGYNHQTHILQVLASNFINPEALTEFSTVIVEGAQGYKKSKGGDEVNDGKLELFVLDNKFASGGSDYIKFKVINFPFKTSPSASTSTIAANAKFYVLATACSESQMHVSSETYLPERFDVYLQKKIVTCVITDEFEGQDKKVSHKTANVLANAEYNFKRKCARSHWISTMDRFDVVVPETGNREAIYTENGILRQIPMLYTHGAALTDSDLLALTTLQFTNNSMSDSATVFCGKKALKRLINLVNSADKYKDVGKVEVNEYGIKVRNYRDNFGSLEFLWDPTLDDIGYEEYMVVLDLKHATRPYKRNESKTTRDMSKTGEAREAKEYNLCKIDCVALNGFNAILVCPSSEVTNAYNLGGIQQKFATWSSSTLPASTDDAWETEKMNKYVLSVDAEGFKAGDVIEYDSEAAQWKYFEGYIGRA